MATSIVPGIGSVMSSQNITTAAPTGAGAAPTGAGSAPAVEVSAVTAAQFVVRAQRFQTVSTGTATVQEMFVNTLRVSSRSDAATGAANMVAAN
ncbi:PE family protein [Mycobacterium simiae]